MCIELVPIAEEALPDEEHSLACREGIVENYGFEDSHKERIHLVEREGTVVVILRHKAVTLMEDSCTHSSSIPDWEDEDYSQVLRRGNWCSVGRVPDELEWVVLAMV